MQVSRAALEAVENFKIANHSFVGGAQPLANRRAQWTCPAAGLLKLDWDAAVCTKSRRMGVGAIIRDEQGRVRAALAKYFPHVSDSTDQRLLHFGRESVCVLSWTSNRLSTRVTPCGWCK